MQDPQTPKKKYNLRKRNKKIHYSRDSEPEDSDEDDSDYIPGNSDEDDDFHLRNWQRFIGKIYPSKYYNNRNKKLKKLDMLQKNYKKIEEEEEEEDEKGTAEYETDEEEKVFEMIDDDEYDDVILGNPNMKVNVIFTVGGGKDGGYYADYEEEELEENEAPEEEKIEFSNGEEIKIKIGKKWKTGIVKNQKNELFDICVNEKTYKKIPIDRIQKQDKTQKILKEMKNLIEGGQEGDESAMKEKFAEMVTLHNNEKKKQKKINENKEKRENVKKFRDLLYSSNKMSDLKYFRTLDTTIQKKIISQIEEINNHTKQSKPYRMTLLETNIATKYKVSAINKINTLMQMDPATGEYYKIKQWVDTFMRIPFDITKQLPIKMADGTEKCQNFIENARKQLDECVYGLNDAKMQILQIVGQLISNPKSVGTAIAIHGPMGTGKTTLVKEGISKILNRPFSFIALGGATDSSFLEGHSYTYEGSSWGHIVEILLNSKCMNPVFYFDELDKVSDTPKGEEIIGILTHLTDTTQNSQFHDKYFSGIDFDLSKALFIFSYNDESKINPILRDRMYRIQTKGFDMKGKKNIAKNYLLTKIEKNINFKKNEIIIPDDTLEYIINSFTNKEKGVRNLKRCLEIIFSKLNLFRFMKADSTLFDKKLKSLNVTFPFTVTREVVNKLIKKQESSIPQGLYL